MHILSNVDILPLEFSHTPMYCYRNCFLLTCFHIALLGETFTYSICQSCLPHSRHLMCLLNEWHILVSRAYCFYLGDADGSADGT